MGAPPVIINVNGIPLETIHFGAPPFLETTILPYCVIQRQACQRIELINCTTANNRRRRVNLWWVVILKARDISLVDAGGGPAAKKRSVRIKPPMRWISYPVAFFKKGSWFKMVQKMQSGFET